ncbi:putative amidohydrolase 2 [Diplodia seriata]|uniref:Putative amidohydrolase 2 n=1 Tax=Diplodia seriata TaxID=420778 RepID=A0A0G2DPV3_9PEZI|nr:putative amidohydrolase 2 [Diplodia seriata]
MMSKRRGTIAIEEAVIPPSQHHTLAQWQPILAPGADVAAGVAAHGARLSDIHGTRLQTMDAEGVEYMLLSLTSPGAQGEHVREEAERVAREANDWLAGEVQKNPARFGALAAVSMHDPAQAAGELRRCVEELGMFGALKRKTRPSKQDYTYYFKHNVHITTSGNFNTAGLKFCINEIGLDRCLYAIGETGVPHVFPRS